MCFETVLGVVQNYYQPFSVSTYKVCELQCQNFKLPQPEVPTKVRPTQPPTLKTIIWWRKHWFGTPTKIEHEVTNTYYLLKITKHFKVGNENYQGTHLLFYTAKNIQYNVTKWSFDVRNFVKSIILIFPPFVKLCRGGIFTWNQYELLVECDWTNFPWKRNTVWKKYFVKSSL